MMLDARSWTRAACQGWKVLLAVSLLVIALVCLVILLAAGNRIASGVGVALMVLLLVAVTASILWTCSSLRCPFCRCRPIWIVLRTQTYDHAVAASQAAGDARLERARRSGAGGLRERPR